MTLNDYWYIKTKFSFRNVDEMIKSIRNDFKNKCKMKEKDGMVWFLAETNSYVVVDRPSYLAKFVTKD